VRCALKPDPGSGLRAALVLAKRLQLFDDISKDASMGMGLAESSTFDLDLVCLESDVSND
jgi:hypothetical protein